MNDKVKAQNKKTYLKHRVDMCLESMLWDKQKGAVHGIDGIAHSENIIETTRNLSNTDEWITALNLKGKWRILDRFLDISGNLAKEKHWYWYRDCKKKRTFLQEAV